MNTLYNQTNRIFIMYDYLMSLGDPRVQQWPFMESPLSTFGILIAYLGIIYIGTKVMDHRKPFECRNVLVIYNFFLVLSSAYLFKEIFQVVYLAKYNLLCEPVDRTNSPLGLRMARIVWLGYLSKLLELLDTVFFVLRKKTSQITFLHLYHHCSIVINSWIGCKYVPGGHSYLIGAANTLVHIFMYTYYGLSALGPRVQKYLWWKRHLTQLQLAQFLIVLVHVVIGMLLNCGYPKEMFLYQICYTLSLAVLFVNFYIKTYLKKESKQIALKKD